MATPSPRDALIRAIQDAFTGVTRTGGISLHEADVIDGYGTNKEREDARNLDRENNWEDVPESDIESYSSILSFLDPIGFRYYIPAYMVWTLRHYQHSDSFSVDHTIYSLALSDKPDIRQWQVERFSIFTRVQANAVLAFLRYMADYSAGRADDAVANAAISEYWETHAKSNR